MQPVPEPAQHRGHIPPWLAILLVCAAVAGAGNVIFWQARLISRQASQLAARTEENDALRRRIGQLSHTGTAPPVPPTPAAPRLTLPQAPAASAEALSAAQQEAQRLRDSLAQSNAEIARLESRISSLQPQVESAAAENRRLSAAAEEGNKNLAEANQTIETIRRELEAGASRVSQLQAANARLREEAASKKQSAAEFSQIASELEGVFRRREMYLNNILRRYKEITEQYRSMSGVLDSRRDREAVPVSSTEISRIQNTIALAEEDLKQIIALNAQAQRLEKKLPAK